MGRSGTRKPRQYNSTLKKLEAHLEQQRHLLSQSAEEAEAELKSHEILADGYCQRLVLYDVILPLHQQWLTQEASTAQEASVHQLWIDGAISSSHREVVGLVDGCNTMLRSLLRATPQQAREAAALTRDHLVQIHRDVVRELLLQLELLSPRRYRGEDIPALAAATGSRAAAAAGGAAAAAAAVAAATSGANRGSAPAVLAEQVREGLPGSCSPQLTAVAEEAWMAAAQAAAQARLEQLVHESLTLGLLVTIHNPPLINEMCSLNLETQQLCVPSMGHFVRVTERLGLTEEQIVQLRLMLRHYNRGMQQQLQQGLQLLQEMEDSAGAAQQLIDRLESHGPSNGGGQSVQAVTGTGSGGQQLRDTSAGGRGTREGSAPQEDSSGQPPAAQERQEDQGDRGQDSDADLAGPDLSERMDLHLHHRVALMQLMGFWVTNTLSTRQVALFFAHSWPYYPVCSAIAEAAALLRPTTADPDTDADAADTHAHMAWRCRGMRAELRWLMQHAPELAGQAHTPHAQPQAEGAAAAVAAAAATAVQ